MSEKTTRDGNDAVEDRTETSGPGDPQATRTSLPAGGAGTAQPMPATIGRFRIVSKIGEGGMGVVYEAEQPEPRRRVALKVIRGGSFIDDNRVRMFRREAETLARLKHPDIAGIYESGRTDDGQHFFAMELVQGETLGEFLAKRPRELRDGEVRFRLRLFRKIADAVHYAHQRGVIHRDLKPSNILVNDVDTAATDSSSATLTPDVKILDFGIARITDTDVAAATVVTEIGMVKGTLPYMSPEQARGNPDEIDTRSDVYALGVILYGVLSGQRPYDTQKTSLVEALRIICEEPPRPLRTVWSGTRRLDPDIETIVGKALEKDADRRYASAAALSQDIERFLGSQPILARPPSTIYQLRKFAQRHRALVAGAVVVLAALVLGLVGATWGLARARTEAARATQVATLMQEILGGVSPSVAQGEDTTLLRGILDDASARVEQELEGQPVVEATMRSTLASVYYALGDYGAAEPHILAAAELRRQVHGSGHVEVSKLERDLGVLRRGQGRIAEAEPLLLDALDALRREYGENHSETLRTKRELATLYLRAGRYADAESLYREVIEADPPDGEKPQGLYARNGLGLSLLRLGRPDEAEQVLVESVRMHRDVKGDTHPDTLVAAANLAGAYGENGRFDQAEKLHLEIIDRFREVYGEDHPKTLAVLGTLGGFYRDTHQLERAEAIIQDVLARSSEVLGPEHRRTLRAMSSMARLRMLQERFNESEALLRELREINRRIEDEDGARLAAHGLAQILRARGEYDEAEEIWVQLIDTSRATGGGDPTQLLLYLSELGQVFTQTGRFDEAEAAQLEALEGRRALLGDGHPDTLVSLNTLGVHYMQQGRFEDAYPMIEQTLELQRVRPGADHPDTLITQSNLGHALLNLDRLDEAATTFEDLYARAKRIQGPAHGYTVAFGRGLVTTYMKLERWDAAEVLVVELIDAVDHAERPDLSVRARLLVRLSTVQAETGDPVSAEASAREAMELYATVLPAGHYRWQIARGELGSALRAQGRFDEAEPLVVESSEAILGDARANAGIKEAAVARAVRLYEQWGRDESAEGWQHRL